MWLILSLKYELLLGVYNNRRTAEVAVQALKKLDKKRFNEQQIVVHFIDVDEFHSYLSPMFDKIDEEINHVETDLLY